MADIYIKGFQDYLETLCIGHKLVAHDPTDGGQKSFVRFQNPDDLDQLTNNPGPNLVVVSRFYGKAVGDMDDQLIRQYIQIRFATYAATTTDGTNSQSITGAVEQSFLIMLDFVARMLHDVRDDQCGPLVGIELDQITWDEIPEQPWLLNHYGWDLTIPLRSVIPNHDPSKWNN